MGLLAITRKVAGTAATASAMNTNYDEIEAVVNGGIDENNLEADGVHKEAINVDCVRAGYGLSQHTDGSLQVDPSDTNPGVELTDGGLRVKSYGLNQRTANGLEVGRTGDLLLSSAASVPDGWTDVSATYANKFIRISATALSAGGSDTHDHGAATGSHTLTVDEIPAHTHTLNIYNRDGGGANASESDASSLKGAETTSSTGGGSGHTHTIASADNIPAYVTSKLFQKD